MKGIFLRSGLPAEASAKAGFGGDAADFDFGPAEVERIGNRESTRNDPFGHRRQQPRIPFISLIRLKKPALAFVPAPDGAQMSYAAGIDEP
jgi:hypothetical protein